MAAVAMRDAVVTDPRQSIVSSKMGSSVPVEGVSPPVLNVHLMDRQAEAQAGKVGSVHGWQDQTKALRVKSAI